MRPGQRSLKRVIAELGGKNAIIVDDDVDLDAVVEGVLTSAFWYAGQKCSACSRAIVLEGRYEEFVARLVGAAGSLRVGDPADPATRVGPVINRDAFDKIRGYIAQGEREARAGTRRPRARRRLLHRPARLRRRAARRHHRPGGDLRPRPLGPAGP